MSKFLFTAFLQALGSGAVAASIVSRNWPVVFVATFILNTLWWFNMGKRIDYHQHRYAGSLYSAASAGGVVLGAWFWR